MTPNEISRVQQYLRQTFSNNRIRIMMSSRADAPLEVHVGEEFIGTLYSDDEDGERSYALTVSILEEDLPSAGSL